MAIEIIATNDYPYQPLMVNNSQQQHKPSMNVVFAAGMTCMPE